MKKISACLLALLSAVSLSAVLSACTSDEPAADTKESLSAETVTDNETPMVTAPDPTEETEIEPPVETIPETLAETPPPETYSETQPESETFSETAPEVLPALSPTPAEEIVATIASDAKVLASSTIGGEVILRDQDTPDAVVAAFLAAGYYDYPVQRVAGAKFTVRMLLGEMSVVTVYHYADRRETRVVWEDAAKFDSTVLKPNAETNTGKITFAQVGTERVSEKDNPMIGLIHILKLSDGRAVIIDGGTGNERNVENILSTLGKLDVTKDSNGRYVVAAWLLTHAHGDHVGAVTTLMKTRGDAVAVETFIYNFTKDAAVIGSTSGNIDPFTEAIAATYPDARHLVAHAGVKYFFGNLTVSMLHAPELTYTDQAPLAYYNNSSLVFRLSVGRSSLFEIGDAGEVASETLMASYDPLAFRSHVLQITHHGLYTESGAHTWNYLKQVYDSVDADMAILPMQSKYAADTRNGRYTVMHDWARAGYQISYIMNLSDVPAMFATRMSQALWDEFETKGTLRGKAYDTLYGYDGNNTVTRADGFVTYLGANRTTPMVVLLELDGETVRLVENQEFYTWIG